VNAVYRRQQALFLRFLDSLGLPRDRRAGLFRSNLINNLLLKVTQARGSFSGLRKYGKDRFTTPLVLERKKFIYEAPLESLEEEFPMEGYEGLRQAYQAGRGVILLSFHGTPLSLHVTRLLARKLGSPKIQTISHNSPLWQSALHDVGKDNLPSALAASLYAEAAYHGLQLLQQGSVGSVVQILADKFAKAPGRTYLIPIGDRAYTIKTGFAELSLNTGAPLIPFYAMFLEDGRLKTILQTPLDPGPGDREQQIESLVHQYGRFMDSTLRNHPEILSWVKIRNHLNEPRIAR
jgi:lauroyl/myristoyl acyltransferase